MKFCDWNLLKIKYINYISPFLILKKKKTLKNTTKKFIKKEKLL